MSALSRGGCLLARFGGVLTAVLIGSVGASQARAVVLASSDFSSTAGASYTGDASRFSLNGDGTITARYDTSKATSKMLWSLGASLTDGDAFSYSARFTIKRENLSADPFGFAQIAFGLVNATATGDNRTGGPTFSGADGSAYDVVTFDYFPNVTLFGGPTLGPTVIGSDDGSGFFNRFVFPFGAETDMSLEGSLPVEQALDATVVYEPITRTLTLGLAGLSINSGGGADGDTSTIQSVLPAGASFDVDSFALLLWEDEYRYDSGTPTVRADVVFDSFEVQGPGGATGASVPEPMTAATCAMAIATLALRRRKQA